MRAKPPRKLSPLASKTTTQIVVVLRAKSRHRWRAIPPHEFSSLIFQQRKVYIASANFTLISAFFVIISALFMTLSVKITLSAFFRLSAQIWRLSAYCLPCHRKFRANHRFQVAEKTPCLSPLIRPLPSRNSTYHCFCYQCKF